MDVAGAGCLVALLVWIAFVTSWDRGRVRPVMALLLAAAACVYAARWLAERHPTAVLAVVACAPVTASLFASGGLTADPLGYANASGALFLLSGAAAITAAPRCRTRVARSAWYVVATIWLLAPWITGSLTAGLFGVLVLLAPSVIDRAGTVRRMVLGVGSLVLVGLVLAGALGAGYVAGPRTSPTDRLVDGSVGELRVVLWSEAIELLREEPLRGVGAGRFAERAPTASSREDARWAHNEYLQFAAEHGVPGALLLLGLVGWALARLWAGADRSVAATVVALGGVAVNANIDYVGHFAEVVLLSAALLGAATVPRASAEEHQPAPHSARRLALATALLWSFLLLPLGILNPTPSVANGAAPARDGGGIELGPDGGLRSVTPPSALYERLTEAGQLTIEVVVTTADLDQVGPARLVSLSDGTIHRNLTVGQQGRDLVVRVRTTRTDWNGTTAEVVVADVFRSTGIAQHVAVTTDLDRTDVYVDGDLRWSGVGPGGTLANWNHGYPLLVGNEAGGDRPWRGELDLLAIHDRVLSGEDLRRRADGSTDLGDAHPRPAALYTFRDLDGLRVRDLGPTGAGGDLEAPTRFPSPSSGLPTALLDAGERPVARFAGHTVVFAAWVLALAAGSGAPVSGSRKVLTAASAMAGATIVVRYGLGRAPSLVDAGGALTGCVLVLAALGARSRSPRSRQGIVPGAVTRL